MRLNHKKKGAGKENRRLSFSKTLIPILPTTHSFIFLSLGPILCQRLAAENSCYPILSRFFTSTPSAVPSPASVRGLNLPAETPAQAGLFRKSIKTKTPRLSKGRFKRIWQLPTLPPIAIGIVQYHRSRKHSGDLTSLTRRSFRAGGSVQKWAKKRGCLLRTSSKRIWQLPTLPHCCAVPSAMAGLTSLFGKGRGEHRRQYHHKILKLKVIS